MAQEQPAPQADIGQGWRDHLAFAVDRPDQTLILGDMDAAGALALRVRCQRPGDLIHLARALLEHAGAALAEAPNQKRAELFAIVEGALRCLPEADA